MVRFADIFDARQHNNGSDIIVADYFNCCIRKVNRHSRLVSTFAGTCSQNWNDVDVSTNAKNATFSSPVSLLYHKERDVFYYLLQVPTAIIVEHDIIKGEIQVFT